jgi:putative membrane protein
VTKVPTRSGYATLTLEDEKVRPLRSGLAKEDVVMWGWPDHSWWWALTMGIGMLGFWVLVALLLVTLLRRAAPTEAGSSKAEAILAARYARGEIETGEYRTRLDELRTDAGARDVGH